MEWYWAFPLWAASFLAVALGLCLIAALTTVIVVGVMELLR